LEHAQLCVDPFVRLRLRHQERRSRLVALIANQNTKPMRDAGAHLTAADGFF
jgi:hypothetical protein